MQNKKISIVTVTKNSEINIEKSINSFFSQNYDNKELIIIDGLSTDNTLKIIDKYKNNIYKIVSEKDSGVYAALNKGFKFANGDVIGILHSDDYYYDDNSLSKVMNIFNNNNLSIAHTNVKINYKKFSREFKSSKNFNDIDFSKGRMPPHPGIFFKKKILELVGSFDLKFDFASDFDFIIRCFKNIPREEIRNLDFFSVVMKSGGKSTSNILNIYKQNIECMNILKKNNIKFNRFDFILSKILNRIKQIKWGIS